MKNYRRKINSVKIRFRTSSPFKSTKSLFNFRIKNSLYAKKN